VSEGKSAYNTASRGDFRRPRKAVPQVAGPVIVCAWMQAAGIVNDPVADGFRYDVT
jgi:3-methyladenine DNA glycosylase Tag